MTFLISCVSLAYHTLAQSKFYNQRARDILAALEAKSEAVFRPSTADLDPLRMETSELLDRLPEGLDTMARLQSDTPLYLGSPGEFHTSSGSAKKGTWAVIRSDPIGPKDARFVEVGLLNDQGSFDIGLVPESTLGIRLIVPATRTP